jgi:type IV secretory pathway TrbL component
MTGVDMAPHQVALTLIALFVAVIIWIVVVVGPDADPKSRPETTVVEAAMESASVEASKATTVTAAKTTKVAAASAAEATAVAATTPAAAAVARRGDVRAQQAN